MRLNKKQVREIRTRLANGEQCTDLAKEYGVHKSTISRTLTRKLGVVEVRLSLDEAMRIFKYLNALPIYGYLGEELNNLPQDRDLLLDKIQLALAEV